MVPLTNEEVAKRKIPLSGKERAKNHRERKKAEALMLPDSPEVIREKFKHSQKSLLWSRKWEQVDYHEEAFNSVYYLVYDPSINKYYIYRRHFKAGNKNAVREPLNPTPQDEVAAKAEFALLKAKKSHRWQTVDYNLEKAAHFDLKYKQEPTSSFGHMPLQQFSFLMAVYEINTNGYSIEKNGKSYSKTGSKNALKERQKQLASERRLLTNLLENPMVPPMKDVHAWEYFLEKIFESIANDVNEEGLVSEKTYDAKSICILKMLETLKNYYLVFGAEIGIIADKAKAKYKTIKETYQYNPREGTGTIFKGSHFKPIDIKKLSQLLDQLWADGEEYFHNALVGLSTCARPGEVERLLEDPEKFIKDGNFLDYKGGLLITKTVTSENFDDIQNPQIQIVTKIILKHYKCKFHNRYFSKKVPGGFRENPDFEDCFFRRFRTTGATMLKYCSSEKDTQTRMGHVTNQMTNLVYAKNVPDTKEPALYFNMDGTFTINSVDVAKGSSLWDQWLLKVFMMKHMEKMSKEEKTRFKEICLAEAREFIKIKTGDANDIQGCKF